jgi:antitoxin (DNA-binding transcriptional repressor) of toxin-antitoxin stability system
MTDMDCDVSVPEQRRPEREIGIRELRNAGKVVTELTAAGAVGRVTSGGRLVAWLVPASPDEQRLEELRAEGRVRARRRPGLAGRRPLPRREDVPTLGETYERMRAEEDR